jgi:hypothetical protein
VYLIEVHVVVFILPQCNGKGQFSCHIQNFRAAGRSSAVCVCVCVCACAVLTSSSTSSQSECVGVLVS